MSCICRAVTQESVGSEGKTPRPHRDPQRGGDDPQNAQTCPANGEICGERPQRSIPHSPVGAGPGRRAVGGHGRHRRHGQGSRRRRHGEGSHHGARPTAPSIIQARKLQSRNVRSHSNRNVASHGEESDGFSSMWNSISPNYTSCLSTRKTILKNIHLKH